MICDWILSPESARRKRPRPCGAPATRLALFQGGNWPELDRMGLCDEHAACGRLVFPASTRIEVEPYGEWLRAACWCVLVASKLGDRLKRYFRGESWPYDQPEPLDYTAHAIYLRARERLNLAAARLERSRRSSR